MQLCFVLATIASMLSIACGNDTTYEPVLSERRTTDNMDIPTPEVNSDTFRLMNEFVCPDEVADGITKFYEQNLVIIHQCANDTGYQIFPYSGQVPTPDETSRIVNSLSCLAMLTGVELLDLPECTLGTMAVKATVDTLLEISIEMDFGRPPPEPLALHNTILWRHFSNLATAASVPNGSDSMFYAIFEHNLQIAKKKYSNVRIGEDLAIEFRSSKSDVVKETSVSDDTNMTNDRPERGENADGNPKVDENTDIDEDFDLDDRSAARSDPTSSAETESDSAISFTTKMSYTALLIAAAIAA